jgi:hypothetical protein
MDDSLSEWLALREAADWAARSEGLVRRLHETLGSASTVCGLDLCTGTGSNIRYLMDRLPGYQRWLAIDRDSGLLAEVPSRLSSWARERGRSIQTEGPISRIRGGRFDCEVETRQMDLVQLDGSIFEGRNLVAASALLDLVSESWLELLASRCRAAGAAALFTISYNGRSFCEPIEAEDEVVRELVNRHQRTDKGLGGPAAGPDGWFVAERVFEEAGSQVERACSDWLLEPWDQRFQRRLIEGWAHAATEIAPFQADTITDWRRRRLEHVEARRSRIVVSHSDMVAWFPVPRCLGVT